MQGHFLEFKLEKKYLLTYESEFLSLPLTSSKCRGFDEPYVVKIQLKSEILTTLRRDIQCESLFRRSQPVL